ncbi:hypothetical protein IFM89_023884 [Coptis chinensis]|uniref:CASP-like protein n=1 Tax=Coptis chinensis TaxID=261450 RepID=A0A835M3Y4_9MAGN|nr:hypothetical protein IFM89_023884 [Coptis chinensis]
MLNGRLIILLNPGGGGGDSGKLTVVDLLWKENTIFAFVMMSAGSAASGVTNLNKTGIRHSALPDLCKPLHRFCDRIAVSIAFTFFSCFLLGVSVVLDVIWLSKH